MLLLIVLNVVRSSKNKRKQSSEQSKKLKLLNNGKMLLSQNLLHFTAAYLMPQSSMKMKSIHKQMRRIASEHYAENLFPNQSPVAIFRHRETNEIIWEDAKDFINPFWKENIGNALQKHGEEKSFDLYHIISEWDDSVPNALFEEVKPLVKELMLPLCDMESVYQPLQLVVRFDAVDALKKLIGKGADVNQSFPICLPWNGMRNCTDWQWPSMLHYAVFEGHVATTEFLLQNGANVNDRSSRGCENSPMMIAIYEDNLDMVKRLARRKAEITKRDWQEIQSIAVMEIQNWIKKNNSL